MRPRFAAYLVAAAALVAYGNSVFHEFVYDDDLTITRCAMIKSWSHIGQLFTQDYFLQTMEMSYRPFVTFTLFADHWLFGEVAFGYHLTSVLWHVAASLALWDMLRRITGGDTGAVLAAALFAIHPLTSEAVNAISFREDVITGAFACAAVTLSIRALTRAARPALPLAGAGLCLFVACLAKESGGVIPLLIGLWVWLHPEPLPRPRLLALAATLTAVTAAWALIRFVVMVPQTPLPVPLWGRGPADAVWNFPRIFFLGLRHTVLPTALAADYEWQATALGRSLALWLGWLGVLLWGASIVWARRRHAPLALGLGWYLIFLLPVSNLVRLANPVAERYYYVPLMGLALAVAWGLERLSALPALALGWRRRLVPGLATLCALPLLAITVNHNLVWGDAERLWVATLEVQPNSTTALNNLACIRLAQGHPEVAADLLRRAIAINPYDCDTVYNLGVAHANQGDWRGARAIFDWLAEQKPDAPSVRWWLAQCLLFGPEPDAAQAWEQMELAERLGYAVPRGFRSLLRERLEGGAAS